MLRKPKKQVQHGIYRQGDIFFFPMPSAPKCPGKPVPSGIVATGEATGHAHKLIIGPGITLFDDDQGTMWIRVEEGKQGLVKHQEHRPIALPAGDWLVRRQREYTPEAIRAVRD